MGPTRDDRTDVPYGFRPNPADKNRWDPAGLPVRDPFGVLSGTRPGPVWLCLLCIIIIIVIITIIIIIIIIMIIIIIIIIIMIIINVIFIIIIGKSCVLISFEG